jgi:DNA-directed RNA polymerase beta' subunit
MLYPIIKTQIDQLSLKEIVSHILRDYQEIIESLDIQISFVSDVENQKIRTGYLQLNDELLNNSIDDETEAVIISTLKKDLNDFFSKFAQKMSQNLQFIAQN